MCKISIIVPVYKVEPYIHCCINSILSQTYTDFELILVDDGSPDNCPAICDEYAAKDSRVTVIHQKNGGAAAAKNAGLRIATGKYLSFVDSDDYLEPDAYRHMLKLLNDHDAEVVQCSYRDVFLHSSKDCLCPDKHKVYDTKSYLRLYTSDWTCGMMTDKLFLRELFDGIFFEEGHKIDDEYFTYRGIMNARKIVRDDFVVYNYRKRRSSVMYSPESACQIIQDRVDYLSKRRRNVITRFPELREVFDRHFVEMMVILFRDPMATKECRKRIRKQMNTYFREKNHTAVDIHLWPAMIEIVFGLPRKNEISSGRVSDSKIEQYFD